jgi:hypothetical protein
MWSPLEISSLWGTERLKLKFLQGKCLSTLVRPCFYGRGLLSLFPFVPM